MGSIINFIELVLRRLDRLPAKVLRQDAAVPTATFDEHAFREALERLDRASPSEVLTVGPNSVAACLRYGRSRRLVANVAMQAFPESAWVLTFDGDGYIREAALRRLTAPAHSTGRFVAIASRLNDWVPQVRAEAISTAGRVWPSTSTDIIADAAPFLLRQRFAWARWGEQERALLDDALGRQDVAVHLGKVLMSGRFGPLGSILRNALRFPHHDPQLVDLAFGATSAAVRAVALKTLVDGRATWTVGYGLAWVDKTQGVCRRIPLIEGRDVVAPEPGVLIRKGLEDASALVRRIAASALIEYAADMPDAAEIANRLMSDRSAAVRDRADFLLRHLTT